MKRFEVAAIVGFLLSLVVPPEALAEFQLALYTGKSFTLKSDLEIHQPSKETNLTFGDVSFNDKSFSPPYYYGFKAGYFPEAIPFLGFEFDFFHFKIFSEVDRTVRLRGIRQGVAIDTRQQLREIVKAFNISHGVNYFALNIVGRLRLLQDANLFPHGRIQPYIGVGGGPVILHPEVNIENEKQEQYELGAGIQTFAGVKVFFFKHVGLFTEYKFTHSNFTVNLRRGEGETTLNTHHAMAGIVFQF
ncbi:MAG: hypothetical protein HY731_10870 [Candidatus Tectomicrobia bacterium]|nr:hypothetical protein [Candidatus Tectomicrobia bacterium]